MGWYVDGGLVTKLLLVVGLIGVALLLERLYVIVFRSKNNGRFFIERIIQLVRAGKVDEAIKQCASSTAALPDMGLLILRSRSRDEADLQNVADAASLAVVPNLTRRLQYLTSLSIVAVLMGLFGTVEELRRTLGISAAAAVPDRGQLVLAGVVTALNPTALGLLIAIVLTLGRTYLASQADAIIEQIQEFSARLINALIDRPDVRLGHR